MVIQRLQNLYLFIAIVLVGLFCFMPFLQFTTMEVDYSLSILALKTLGISDSTNMMLTQEINTSFYTWGYFSIGALITLLLIIALFKFKDLKRQRKIVLVAMVILICFYFSTGIYSWFVFQSNGMQTWSLSTAAIFPPIAVIILGLAYKSITNDIHLLNTSSRIR